MDMVTARWMLKEKRQWWEAAAEYIAEGATADSQSNFSFRLALRKLQAIAHNEKRLAIGTFGRCERCGAPIDDERLEMILDSEFHYCLACAAKPATMHARAKPVRPLDGSGLWPQVVGVAG